MSVAAASRPRLLHHRIQPLMHIPDSQSRRRRAMRVLIPQRLRRRVRERGLRGGAEGGGERCGGDAGRGPGGVGQGGVEAGGERGREGLRGGEAEGGVGVEGPQGGVVEGAVGDGLGDVFDGALHGLHDHFDHRDVDALLADIFYFEGELGPGLESGVRGGS